MHRHAWLAVLFFSTFASPAFADKRVALVVGNSAYQNVARLDNPRNDAKLMADTLKGLGFILVGNGAQSSMANENVLLVIVPPATTVFFLSATPFVGGRRWCHA